MWQIWLIISGVCLIVEIMTVGFLLFWFGIASLISMVVSFFTSNLVIQMVVFLVSSVILILATKPFVKKFMNKKNIATNAYSLIGKTGLVIQEIDNVKGIGQIKVGGEVWSAQSEDNSVIPVNTEIELTKIDGVKAIVKPIKISITN